MWWTRVSGMQTVGFFFGGGPLNTFGRLVLRISPRVWCPILSCVSCTGGCMEANGR